MMPGVKLPDLKEEGPREERSFKWLLGFSVAAAVVHFGRMAFLWHGQKELALRLRASGPEEAKVGAATEFLKQLRFADQIGWSLLAICCVGFLISAFFWLKALKAKQRSGAKS